MIRNIPVFSCMTSQGLSSVYLKIAPWHFPIFSSFDHYPTINISKRKWCRKVECDWSKATNFSLKMYISPKRKFCWQELPFYRSTQAAHLRRLNAKAIKHEINSDCVNLRIILNVDFPNVSKWMNTQNKANVYVLLIKVITIRCNVAMACNLTIVILWQAFWYIHNGSLMYMIAKWLYIQGKAL